MFPAFYGGFGGYGGYVLHAGHPHGMVLVMAQPMHHAHIHIDLSASDSPVASREESHTQYHGTTAAAARSILNSGLNESDDGQMGAGRYLADQEKAERFARQRDGSGGVVLRCSFTTRNPKYVTSSSDAGNWRAQGYDAVHAERTGMSTNPEWCVRAHVSVDAWRYANSSSWNNTSSRP
jgi:hypothetical protein